MRDMEAATQAAAQARTDEFDRGRAEVARRAGLVGGQYWLYEDDPDVFSPADLGAALPQPLPPPLPQLPQMPPPPLPQPLPPPPPPMPNFPPDDAEDYEYV
tara:strand:+ start:480 stop:782 length:303 start_codon:yes stop_codon:yes gene_type:complete